MKRKRVDEQHSFLDNFYALRQIKTLNVKQCKAVLELLHPEDAGGSTASRVQHRYPQAIAALREVKVPSAISSETQSVWYMHVPTLVEQKVLACPLYRACLSNAAKAHSNSLTLICFSDEVTPGNLLSPIQPKKSNLVYIGWLEFPMLFLEDMWLPLHLMRHAEIDECQHGLVTVMRRLMEAVRESTVDGFPVSLHGQETPQLLFIRKVLYLADHEGLRATLACKGAAGIKPCVKCVNVISKDSQIPNHVHISETNVNLFQEQTNSTVQEALSLLEGIRTKTELQSTGTLLGWNPDKIQDSLLNSPLLNGWMDISSCNYDAMHDYWSNGVIAQELGLFYSKLCDDTDVTLQHLVTYAQMWQSVKGSFSMSLPAPSKLFTARLWKKGRDFRGDASMCNVVLSICASFAEEVLLDTVRCVRNHVHSIVALRNMTSFVQQVKIDPTCFRILPSLQKRHMESFIKAYGRSAIRPKMHYGLHLPSQVEQWGRLVDCFCCERKHQNFKSQIAPNLKNLSGFSKSGLLQLVTRDLACSREAEKLGLRLVGAQQASTHVNIACGAPAMLSWGVEKDGVTYCRNQFLILSSHCAIQVECALRTDGQFYLLAQTYQPTKDPLENHFRTCWRKNTAADSLGLVEVRNLQARLTPVYQRQDENGQLWLLQ